MRRYELGMSLDYCQDWGVTEAVREIFQNALDEETVNPENKMYFEYKDNKLYIGNKLSKLDAQTLLLGVSSKRDNENLIGTHGEGYKVATIVLARNNVSVTIYNNEREVWHSRVIRSRRYNTDICVFDIEKKIFKQENNLLFVLDGITEEMYLGIVEKNLNLQKDIGETRTSEYGRVLLDNRFKGKIFVSGLYVCTREQFELGYDFKPNMVKLDRDRGLIDSFDLNFATSKLLAGVDDADFLFEIVETHDAQFLSTYMFGGAKNELGLKLYDDYSDRYGDDFIPVITTSQYNEVREAGGNAVLVSNSIATILKPFTKEHEKNITDLDSRYKIWRSSVAVYLTSDKLKEIDELWEEAMKK